MQILYKFVEAEHPFPSLHVAGTLNCRPMLALKHRLPEPALRHWGVYRFSDQHTGC